MYNAPFSAQSNRTGAACGYLIAHRFCAICPGKGAPMPFPLRRLLPTGLLVALLAPHAEDTPRPLRGRGLRSALTEDNPTAI